MKIKDLQLTMFGNVKIGEYFWRVNECNKHQKARFLKVSETEGKINSFVYPFGKLQFVYVVKQ